MKTFSKLFILIALIFMVALAFPGQASAAGLLDDKVVFGGSYRLDKNETLDGNLTVFGGAASTAQDSKVNGNVTLLGGALEIDGAVNGNVTALGGTISLGDHAVVTGNVATAGGTLRQSDTAKVQGEVINGESTPFNFNVPNQLARPSVSLNLNPIWDFLGYLGNSFLLAALAMLIVLFWPKPAERVANTVVAQPVISGGLGLLTAVVAPVLVILVAVTIILIPVSLLGILVLILAALFGWIAVGLEVGNRMGQLFKSQWHPAIYAGLGTLLMSLVVNAIGWIPCIGWIAPFTVSMIGLGAVIVTRFGTQIYPNTTPMAAAPLYQAVPLAAAMPVVPPAPAPIREAQDTPAAPPEESEHLASDEPGPSPDQQDEFPKI